MEAQWISETITQSSRELALSRERVHERATAWIKEDGKRLKEGWNSAWFPGTLVPRGTPGDFTAGTNHFPAKRFADLSFNFATMASRCRGCWAPRLAPLPRQAPPSTRVETFEIRGSDRQRSDPSVHHGERWRTGEEAEKERERGIFVLARINDRGAFPGGKRGLPSKWLGHCSGRAWILLSRLNAGPDSLLHSRV